MAYSNLWLVGGVSSMCTVVHHLSIHLLFFFRNRFVGSSINIIINVTETQIDFTFRMHMHELAHKMFEEMPKKNTV